MDHPLSLLVRRSAARVVRVGPLVLLLVAVGPLRGLIGTDALGLTGILLILVPLLLPASFLLIRREMTPSSEDRVDLTSRTGGAYKASAPGEPWPGIGFA